VFDPDALDDPVRADVQRQRRQGAQRRDRDAGPLDLLADRCAATIAGPSGRDQQRAGHAVRL
jgi:hypothetical protein